MSEQFFEVGKIIGRRITGQGIEYKVHWKGYSDSFDSWEPVDLLSSSCHSLLEEFNKNMLRKTPASPSRSRSAGRPSTKVKGSASGSDPIASRVSRSPRKASKSPGRKMKAPKSSSKKRASSRSKSPVKKTVSSKSKSPSKRVASKSKSPSRKKSPARKTTTKAKKLPPVPQSVFSPMQTRMQRRETLLPSSQVTLLKQIQTKREVKAFSSDEDEDSATVKVATVPKSKVKQVKKSVKKSEMTKKPVKAFSSEEDEGYDIVQVRAAPKSEVKQVQKSVKKQSQTVSLTKQTKKPVKAFSSEEDEGYDIVQVRAAPRSEVKQVQKSVKKQSQTVSLTKQAAGGKLMQFSDDDGGDVADVIRKRATGTAKSTRIKTALHRTPAMLRNTAKKVLASPSSLLERVRSSGPASRMTRSQAKAAGPAPARPGYLHLACWAIPMLLVTAAVIFIIINATLYHKEPLRLPRLDTLIPPVVRSTWEDLLERLRSQGVAPAPRPPGGSTQ